MSVGQDFEIELGPDDLGLLSTYLHEHLHWHETRFSHARKAQLGEILNRLRQRYPTVPIGGTDGARDEYSTYLHRVVNWLEVDVTARFLDRAEVERHVEGLSITPAARHWLWPAAMHGSVHPPGTACRRAHRKG